jgi:hypothetical protein
MPSPLDNNDDLDFLPASHEDEKKDDDENNNKKIIIIFQSLLFMQTLQKIKH